ncbi:MAG: hypothetical protein ACRDJ4_08625 [Actinomycetota bacterium]
MTSEERLARRLGVQVQELTSLGEQILSDLDPEELGISWWSPDVPPRPRILIGDYLFQAVWSTQRNLSEAKLHMLEAQQGLDAEDKRFQTSRFSDVREGVLFQRPTSAIDELPDLITDIHIAGFFRACASALDCLAAMVIGILPVEEEIIKADWGRVGRRLTDLARGSDDVRANMARRIMDEIAAAGPSAWIRWLLDMRNMYVHRSRILNIRTTQQSGPAIFVSMRRAYLPARIVGLLPRFPSHSDIQVIKGTPRLDAACLAESCETTMEGIMESVLHVISATTRILTQVWDDRKSGRVRLPQPHEKQWRLGDQLPSDAFSGYAQRPVNLQLDYLVLHPNTHRRYLAAALSDETKSRWDDFA